ncbi:MAG: thioredoxin fold domain-containing protein [Pseudomonadota bacterium]
MTRILVILLALLPQVSQSNETPLGNFYGAQLSEKPEWFKESFLEFEEDVAEARDSGKRVMIYFHQDGCPYCARLVEENFQNPEIENFVKSNFDGISLNMWGDREVVSVAGQDFTEKTFAAALKVQYTPTMIFLDEAGKVALRLNGYYPPKDFRAALRFVAGQHEKKMNFSQYRASLEANPSNELIDEDFYIKDRNLQKLVQQDATPLAVYFETGNCVECTTLHQRILLDEPTRKLVRQMQNVQLAVHSDEKIVSPSGVSTTMREWAQALDISYTPSVVFFDETGQEVMRISGFVKTFHFQSVYAYVLEKAYISQPSFQRFIEARADHIREAGFDTDIWGYQSFHD